MPTKEEELAAMIQIFGVKDLQVLLAFAGRKKFGRRRELINRACDLLELKSEPLNLKVREIYSGVLKRYKGSKNNLLSLNVNNAIDSTTERDVGGGLLEKDDSITIVEENETQEKSLLSLKDPNYSELESKKEFQPCPSQPDTSVPLAVNSLYFPVHPDVKFKKLPFYKVLYDLLRPSSLVPQGYHFHQKNSFMFYLTPQQAAAISLSRDTRPGIQNDFMVQVQLRFCLLETTSQQDDSFPANLVVKVNNKFIILQEPPPKKKKDIYVKEPSPPINITPFMKISPAEANKVEVTWNTEYGRAYAMGIFLVQKKTSEDLLNRLKAKGIRIADYTRGMIKDKLNEEADSEIVTTSLRVSLMCPLGKMKLKTPCRATTCQHLQCFDGSLFIQMNEKKPTWMCPVCDNPAEYDNLVIDGYFQEILSSDKLPVDVNEIELHSDGSWSSLATKTESNSSNDPNVAVKVETEDIVEILEDDSKSSSSSSETENPVCSFSQSEKLDSVGTEKRQVDEIDLTISDSDDEPLIFYKRRESSKKRNGVIHSNTNSNRSSPSVINLDSDSSDSLPNMISAQFPLLPPIL